ncbi:MAG: hypothetical protein JXO22_00220, partial [Phycisphaerae bacterium]|nr:hypothetical protein [Phycisphaerae bacterium]
RHHTFFEMLGNFSFGDYFKTEAINWAWELLTKVWGIDPTRLHATYFEGDEKEGLEPDLEAMELWAKILPGARIHPGNKKDNFWEMGDTGPCGPCSEIHVDLTPDKSGAELVNAGDARVIEIWNLVFIQFNRGPDGKLTPLPAKHVDTGMGFERVVALLQGKTSNYDTDVWTPLFDAISLATDTRAYRALMEPSEEISQEEVMIDIAYRVIADHVRCLTFALTDGAVPDRDGRGYVLRRILRRAVRYGWQYMNMHAPFLHKLVPAVVNSMGTVFPELTKDPQRVIDIIREEEESFGRTLERGMELFNGATMKAVARAIADRDNCMFTGATTAFFEREMPQRYVMYFRTSDGGEREVELPNLDANTIGGRLAGHTAVVSGEDAFKLHDTYGFPIDLTQIMADEKGLKVDTPTYERLMAEARERARGTASATSAVLDVSQTFKHSLIPAATDDRYKWDGLELKATCRGHYDPTTFLAQETVEAGTETALILDKTCFYSEAGGQVSDTGIIRSDTGVFRVSSTQQRNDVVLHIGRVEEGRIEADQPVDLKVDDERRATMKNHTVTHVMNWALREVLGEGVQQKGSLVDHEKTRFDFSHSKALNDDEIMRVEALVNERIERKMPVYFANVPQEEALKINGLRAVFGEKYPDVVRVMSIGVPVDELLATPENPAWRDISIEFCGGTHCSNTEQIERFALVTEEAVAKGIRRVVGVTAEAARTAERTGESLVARGEALKAATGEALTAGISGLQQELAGVVIPLRHRHQLNEMLAELQKTAKKQQKEQAAGAADVVMQRCRELFDQAEHVGGVAMVVAEMPDVPVEQLKQGADAIKQKFGSAVVLFGVNAGDKAVLL